MHRNSSSCLFAVLLVGLFLPGVTLAQSPIQGVGAEVRRVNLSADVDRSIAHDLKLRTSCDGDLDGSACSLAIPIDALVPTSVVNVTPALGATPLPSCGAGSVASFYRYRPCVSGGVSTAYTTFGTGGGTLAIFNGCTGSQIGCDFAGFSGTAFVNFTVTLGVEYIVRVADLGTPTQAGALFINGPAAAVDSDGDTVCDALDNCDNDANARQFDLDNDGIGDCCDPCSTLDVTDCNTNGIPDDCDFAAGTSLDCNSTGVPDECELAANDCNNNQLPDECEVDCNTNNVPDECDVAVGSSTDCNDNSTPDECDLAVGTSFDCNFNGLSDACDTQTHFSSQQIISTSAIGALSVYSADLDGDGDFDVLSASEFDNKVAWYANTNGLGGFGPEQTITTMANGAAAVFAADLDGDSDLDVLSASVQDDKVAWYENTNGLGSFGAQANITTNANGARSVYSADLDGDGDYDVLSAYGGRIAWYENTNGLGGFAAENLITTDAQGAKSVFAADLDGDGDIDVLSGQSLATARIAWYQNTNGLGDFGAQNTIATDRGGLISVSSADLDGDGDFDVLSASSIDNRIAWYANTDGLGGFSPKRDIDRAGVYSSAHSVDLDGDGDLDVLTASISDNRIAWHENEDGLGNFGAQITISTDAGGARSVFSADLDGDGDFDVLSASTLAADWKVAWYANIGDDCNGNRIPDECEADTDIDGLIDGCDLCAGGAASGDVNADSIIDLSDYSSFDACALGPEHVAGIGCECFDSDGDGDNDLIDFAVFQRSFSQ